MRKFSLSALVAAGLLVGGLSVGSASAADLGGNCCADLEERIAELEATTARKGNRKVSLTVSGWVAEQVMWWDDGAAKGAPMLVASALPSPATSSSLAKRRSCRAGMPVMCCSLKLMNMIRCSITSSTGQVAAGNLTGLGVFAPVQVLQSYWFIKSDHLGKVSIGQQSSAG